MKDRKSTFLIICLLIVCAYTYIFYLVYSRAEQQHFNAFEVVTGLSGLVISILTIYYVYNTYDVQMKQMELQQKQMDIQKKELKDNKEELERNRQDAEFSRVIDIIYRQLTYTREALPKDSHIDRLNKLIKPKEIDIHQLIVNEDTVIEVINRIGKEVIFYHQLLLKSTLEQSNKDYAFSIFFENIPSQYIELIENVLVAEQTRRLSEEDFQEVYKNSLIRFRADSLKKMYYHYNNWSFDNLANYVLENKMDDFEEKYNGFRSSIVLADVLWGIKDIYIPKF